MKFCIDVPPEEYEAVKIYLRGLNGHSKSVAKMADDIGCNMNHLRYVIDQLVETKQINKCCIDDRPKHKRYVFEVI